LKEWEGMTTKCSNQWQVEGVGLLVFSNKEEMTRERNNNILKL
jgi:beta-lactamase superfamily II metal-dependent hydrolase